MRKFFISLLIISAAAIYTTASSYAATEQTPTINIVKTATKETTESQSKPLKVKTTILTKKEVEKPLKLEEPTKTEIKKEKIDVELPSDVDKILKEMDIDDVDPAEQLPETPVEKAYEPVKKNLFWIALSIVLFPIILFVLLIKTMELTKKRFESDKEGPSKEEQFLDEIEKAQKTTKKKRRSLAEILGHHPKERNVSPRPSKAPAYDTYEDDFEREDDDFEFMVEEVVIVEEKKEEPKKQEQPEPEVQEVVAPEPQHVEPEKVEASAPTEKISGTIDSFEIAENLTFVLAQKDDTINLVCQLDNNEHIIMELDKAQKFNKVRKIDSKPGRDVYMVKLDSWRGLVEIKGDSVKYLMDI